MKTSPWIAALTLLATPFGAALAAQQEDVEHEVRVLRRVLAPRASSAVFIGEDGEHHVIAGPQIEIFGDGAHYSLLGTRRHIGVQLTPLTPELREHFGVDREVGIMVSRVLEGPAAEAGVEVGDIIIAIDGDKVGSSSDLTRVIRGKEDGETVTLDIRRGDLDRTLDVAVAARDRSRYLKLHSVNVDGDDRRVLVLPEIRMQDFRLDSEWMEKLKEGGWSGNIQLDDIQGVLERLNEYFSSDDWNARLHKIEEMDFEQVERKMKEVERRLQQLEDELADR